MGKINLKKLIKEYNENEVFYDESFQRNLCWKAQNVNKYFESLTRDRARSTIVLVDVRKSREHCKSAGEHSSVRYYDDILAEGYKYISLDGQNRTKKIERVLKNHETISGTFKDADGNMIPVKNTFFKDLPQRLQDHLKTGCLVIVEVITDATRADCATDFLSLNEGIPLNDQEKRNAISTPVAQYVRDMVRKYNRLFERITTDKDLARLGDHENMAKMLIALTNKVRIDNNIDNKKWDLTSAKLDEFYNLGKGLHNITDPKSPYIESELNRAENIIKMISATILNQTKYSKSKDVPKKSWWAVTLICEWMYDNGYEVDNYSKFFNGLKKIDDDLAVEAQDAYVSARRAHMQKGIDPDQVKESHYYHKWQNWPHQAASRRQRAAELIRIISTSQRRKGLTILKKSGNIKPVVSKVTTTVATF